MRTTCHPIRYLVQLIGPGLMLASLVGCLSFPPVSLPPGSGAGVKPIAQRPGDELPERYTIHKGKKCEIQCERSWGTRDYQCREYRC